MPPAGIRERCNAAWLQVALAIFPASVGAQNASPRQTDASPPSFKKVALPHGIALEVPTTWIGFSPTMKAQLNAATQAAVDLSGINYDIRGLDPLLDIRQPLKASYARLILTVNVGKRLTQNEVRALSAEDLRSHNAETRKTIGAVAEQMALRILEWHPTERREINGKTFLLVRYVRSSPTPGEATYVELYQLLDTDKSVNFSIEYRLRDKVLWDPICRRSLMSADSTRVGR